MYQKPNHTLLYCLNITCRDIHRNPTLYDRMSIVFIVLDSLYISLLMGIN